MMAGAVSKNRGKPKHTSTHRMPAWSTRVTLVAATGSRTAAQRKKEYWIPVPSVSA
jgi:hypothetical protein